MKRKLVPLQTAFDRVRPLLLTVVLCLVLSPPAQGDDDLRALELFNGSETEVVSGNRSPRPASQTAENITVVTADEIAALNAHTLADILNSVTGIQLEMNRTPGTVTNLEIQGSNFNHVLVLIDNVPINNLSDNFPDVSSVPVQMIERIEVVKGAASTSWGSALGGVINVITKSPDSERAFGGVLSGSFGARETVDGRGEVSGTLNRLGYYLSAGKLRSDGFLPNNDADLSNLYTKIQYALPEQGSLSFTTSYTEGSSGQFALQSFGIDQQNNLLATVIHIDQENHQLISTFALQYPLAHRFTVDASLRTRQSTSEILVLDTTQNFSKQRANAEDASNGATFKVSWLGERQRVVAGIDYDHVKTTLEAYFTPRLGVPPLKAEEVIRADRVGFYLNDTITVGVFSITPSARFDHTGSDGDHFSPSFGITYALSENTVLRGYTARGYSLTSLNRTGSTEKVWTSQLGFESGDLPYLWLKGTLFRNDTWDITTATPGGVVEQRELKQGFELEARTLPLFNTSLSTGYTFIRGTEGGHGRTLTGVPSHTVKIGVRYQDPRDLQAELIGHYISWNEQQDSKYGAVIWDLHVRKKIAYSGQGSLELFFSVRNLLDDQQYLNSSIENTGRWGEAGVRCNF